MLRTVNLVISFLFTLLLLEAVSRGIHFILPLEIQQKYSNAGDRDKQYIVNGRGARAMWPRSEQLQVAILGSSIVAMAQLPETETWTRLLEKETGGRVHFDNFGLGTHKIITAIEILRSFLRSGKHYDIVILNISPESTPFTLQQTFAMSYQSRWDIPPGTWCAFCFLLKGFWQRRLEIEKKSFPAFNFFFPPPEEKNISLSDASLKPGLNRKMYQEARRRGVIHDTHSRVRLDRFLDARNSVQEMFFLAKKITPHVIWMPEAIAYHPKMKESYLDLYITLKKIYPATKPARFYSPKSIADEWLVFQNIVREELASYEVQEMDWTQKVFPYLAERDDLFSDEYHLTSVGSKLVFEVLKPQFLDYLKENFKIENK